MKRRSHWLYLPSVVLVGIAICFPYSAHDQIGTMNVREFALVSAILLTGFALFVRALDWIGSAQAQARTQRGFDVIPANRDSDANNTAGK